MITCRSTGIFDQPFGDWYEAQSPLWVNRFVSAPLLYGVEAIIPPTELGLQLRGGLQWGALGQDLDYTTWVANGPGFDSALPQPQLPLGLDRFIQNLEPLVRYSGVNQRAVVADEISTTPELAFSGSPSIFVPHAREVALGIDYWIEPSIVWQTEFDFELPRAGGTLFSFNGASTATASPIGATSNDHAILTQFAIGF